MTFFSPVIKQNIPTNVCLTRTKQISSELVCGNSFVKILCTYFFCIYLVLKPPTFPPGNIAVFRKVLIRLSSNFVSTSSLPIVASGKNFKGIERDFLVPAGKRLKAIEFGAFFAYFHLFRHLKVVQIFQKYVKTFYFR